MIEKDYWAVGNPWNKPLLYDWDVGAINHYTQDNKRMLFVLMTKGSKCIKAEGHRETQVWEDITRQAISADREEKKHAENNS